MKVKIRQKMREEDISVFKPDLLLTFRFALSETRKRKNRLLNQVKANL